MFYTILKRFFLKKKIAKKLQIQQPLLEQQKIASIGILVDESYFPNSEVLVAEIVKHGFKKEQIQVLVFKDKMKSKEVVSEPFLSLKNISLSGEFDKKEVNEFINKSFDLLINYYDINKSSLLLIATKSKAKFKVGFDSVDKRVNHFIIKLLVENFNEFVLELFKYLKILNKI